MIRKIVIISCIFYIFSLLWDNKPAIIIDEQLKPYQTEYFNLIKYNCPTLEFFYPSRVEIKFGDLPEGVIGLCEANSVKFKVTIDEEFWNRKEVLVDKESDRYQLVMHELTHCMLRLDHIDIGTHFMASYLLPIKKEKTKEQLTEIIKVLCNE